MFCPVQTQFITFGFLVKHDKVCKNGYHTILNPLYTNGFFILVWYNTFGIVHLYISKGVRLQFDK